jgi:fucose permease
MTSELDCKARALILASYTAGCAIGLVVSERLLRRFRPLPLLAASCAASSILYMLWLAASGPVVSGLPFFALGLATSSHYPLASAQAYRALPDRSGSVNAVLSLAFALQLPIPLVLGWVADTFGLLPCLALLIAQPVGLLAITLSQIATEDHQPTG